MKQTLSPSRISTMLSCNRKHYWRYEVGLKSVLQAHPLRFGSAMHKSLEARANGADYEGALLAGIGDHETLNEVDVAVLAALLAGYYRRYENDIIATIHPEVEIRSPIAFSRYFEGICIIDGLGTLKDGNLVMVEHKTTIESIDDCSKYWEGLKYNIQLAACLDAARRGGWNVSKVIYDVIKKPGFELSQIPEVDSDGFKIVEDVNGTRIYLDGKTPKPRQAGDTAKGWFLKKRIETIDEFTARLEDDIATRPDFYVARKEVAILDSDIEEFIGQRDAVARQIMTARREQERYKFPEYAWPRCVGRFTCMGCEMESFCLNGIHADVNHVPCGMRIGEENQQNKEVA